MPTFPAFIYKLAFFIACLAVFCGVIIFVEPPASWGVASVWQIVAFFLPLLLGITAVVDILMHYYPHSFIIALGAILLLAFYAVNQLGLLTGSLIILVIAFSVRMFPKMKLPRFRLTGGSKIPKLHISGASKREEPRIRRLRRLRRNG